MGREPGSRGGWGVQSPVLASLARLLSWAQPSNPCLALNAVLIRGLAPISLCLGRLPLQSLNHRRGVGLPPSPHG